MKLTWIGVLSQQFEADLLWRGEHVSGAQALKGCLSDIIVAFDLVERTGRAEQFFAFQAQDWQEEIVVEPHFVIDLVHVIDRANVYQA